MAPVKRNSRLMENTVCRRFSGTATTTHFIKLDNITVGLIRSIFQCVYFRWSMSDEEIRLRVDATVMRC